MQRIRCSSDTTQSPRLPVVELKETSSINSHNKNTTGHRTTFPKSQKASSGLAQHCLLLTFDILQKKTVGASATPWGCSLSNVWNANVNTLHFLHALPLKTFTNNNNNATTHRAFVRINLLQSLESTALYHSHVITYLVYSSKQKRSQMQYINICLWESSDFFSTSSLHDDMQPHMIVP